MNAKISSVNFSYAIRIKKGGIPVFMAGFGLGFGCEMREGRLPLVPVWRWRTMRLAMSEILRAVWRRDFVWEAGFSRERRF